MTPTTMPAIEPDIEAIDHLEGNERELREYRDAAEADRDRAQPG